MGSSALPIGDAAVEIAWGFGHEGATRQILNAYFRVMVSMNPPVRRYALACRPNRLSDAIGGAPTQKDKTTWFRANRSSVERVASNKFDMGAFISQRCGVQMRGQVCVGAVRVGCPTSGGRSVLRSRWQWQ